MDCKRIIIVSFPKICYNYKKCHNLTISDVSLYHLGDDSTSIGGEKQACISGGVNPPADIASGRAHIVRWTMVLRRPKRSVDLQRCAVEVCHAIA